MAVYISYPKPYTMKSFYILLSAILFTGCTRVGYVDFTADMPGVDNGIFIVKDLNGATIFSENILNGKFQSKKILQTPGYYSMQIGKDIMHDGRRATYDVYLEAGTYVINTEAGKSYKYPSIKSSSKIQNELSDYYNVATEKTYAVSNLVDSLSGLVYAKDAPAEGSPEYKVLLAKLNDAIKDRDNIESAVLSDYVSKHPQNEVESHILAQIDYKKDPASFYSVYQKFTDDQKNTAEGKTEGDDLARLIKLAPGAIAPKLVGKTSDGKSFDPKTITQKVILVEFWQSDSKVSRLNHSSLISDYSYLLKDKNFAIVSVSLDTQQSIWLSAIKEDKMNWIQICDLKGEASPNMADWGVSTVPTYDLLDGGWHFIKRDIDFNDLADAIKDQLAKH